MSTADLDKLREFALKMFALADWPEGGDIDGFVFQDIAEDCGLLEATMPLQPCNTGDEGAECRCLGTFTMGDFAAGKVTCYRKTKLLTGTKEEI